MASLVSFETIDKNWIPHSRGQFEVIFGALYELYLDKNKTPVVCVDIFPMVQRFLHCCWPDKYEKPIGIALDYVPFSDYQIMERREVLQATEKLLQDFIQDRLDPHLDWNWKRRPEFISALRQFISLMREDIAASRPVRLVVGNKTDG